MDTDETPSRQITTPTPGRGRGGQDHEVETGLATDDETPGLYVLGNGTSYSHQISRPPRSYA